jgi:hypothetical protein
MVRRSEQEIMRHYGVERLEEVPSRTAEKLRRRLQEIRRGEAG